MKTTRSQMLLQTSIVILLAVVSPSIGDTDHLEKWLNSAAVKKLLVSQSIISVESVFKIHHLTDDIAIYEQTAPIIVAARKTDAKMLKKGIPHQLYVRPESDMKLTDINIDGNIYSEANFLPYGIDKAHILVLSHRRAPWFATAQLSGCDVWIAMDNHEGAEPLIIHINGNSKRDDPVGNLQHKELLAKEALGLFNKKNKQSYKFQLRISYDYVKMQPKHSKDIKRYWQLAYNGPPVVIYSNTAFFYGVYNAAQLTWDFRLKDTKNGKILWKTKKTANTKKPRKMLSQKKRVLG